MVQRIYKVKHIEGLETYDVEPKKRAKTLVNYNQELTIGGVYLARVNNKSGFYYICSLLDEFEI